MIASLATLLIALPLVGARSSWAAQPTLTAQPTIAAVAAGAGDGRARLVLDLPGEDRFALSPESFSVSVEGQPLPITAGPVMSDRLSMALVIDASQAAAPVLQRGLTGAVDFTLATPPAVRSVLVADASPPSVVTPLQPGPAAMLEGLSRVESHGARQTVEAVELALHHLPVETDGPRLIVLYTAAPDAAGYSAAELAARLTSAGVVLAVVSAVGDDAAAPSYWSSVAAATGGVAVGVRGADVVDAFARLHTALRARYLLTFPAPNRLPADAVVRIDTPSGPLTAGAVIPAPTPTRTVNAAGTRVGQPVGPALGLATLALVVGGAAVARARSRRRGTALIAHPTPTNRRTRSTGGDSAEIGRPDIHHLPAPRQRREQPHRDEHPVPTEPMNDAPVAGPVWNIPSRHDCVVDREPGRAAIRTALHAGRPVVLQAADYTAGLGTTTAMIEYAHRSRDQYDIAWWITAEDPPLVSDQMAQLAQALGLAAPTDTTEQATAKVLEALRRRDRWLLIFDDAVSARDLLRFLPSGPGDVLVGSPDPQWQTHGTMLAIQRFTRAESIELLQTRLPGLEAGEADRLADALEDLPLAVDLAAATVTGTGLSVDTYLRLLSSYRTDGATKPTPSVAACSVALDRLSVDDPPASALLTIAAWLGRPPAPLSLLTRHADQLPAPLAQTARSPAQLADLATTLRRRGLARVESNSVQLHRTPADQLLARTVDDRPDQLAWPAWTVRLLRAAMPTQPHDPAGWPVWRQLLPHVLTATDPTRHLDDVTLEVGWLLNHAASYLQARGEPRAARALFEDAYDLYRRRLGHGHPDTLASARTLVQDLHALGQHEQAHRILQDAHLDQA